MDINSLYWEVKRVHNSKLKLANLIFQKTYLLDTNGEIVLVSS